MFEDFDPGVREERKNSAQKDKMSDFGDIGFEEN